MNASAPLIRPAGFFTGPDGRIRPVWRAMLYAIAGLIALIAAIVLVVMLAEAIAPGTMRSLGSAEMMIARPVSFTLIYAIANAGFLLLAWLFLSVFDGRSFRTLGVWFYSGWGRELLTGVALGGGVLVVVVLLSVALHATQLHGHGTSGISPDLVLGWLKIALLLLFAAANEELLFRGYAFQRLVNSVGALWAVVFASALFGVAHLFNPSPSVLSTANTVLAGILLSLAYLKTRALWLPIGLHWSWNLTMGPVLGLPVSGLNVVPTLIRSEATGPAWLTGGSYGPEGGIVMTVVCAVVANWLARSRKLAPSPAMAEVLK